MNNRIIKLLSQCRQSDHPALPGTLTKTRIISLLRQSVEPSYPAEELETVITTALDRLVIQRELIKVTGNHTHYCMAQPTLLAMDDQSLRGLKFRGDRAYLLLAHQILQTGQTPTEEQRLNSGLINFRRIKDRLKEQKIRLFTMSEAINEAIDNLPIPQRPQPSSLKQFSPPDEIPSLERYQPTQAEQEERWQPSSLRRLSGDNLLRFRGDQDQSNFNSTRSRANYRYQYLWSDENQNLYELETQVAYLTMFYLDKKFNYPIRVVVNSGSIFDLTRVWLPHAYYTECRDQEFWETVEGETRIFKVFHANLPFVRAIFNRLGCELL